MNNIKIKVIDKETGLKWNINVVEYDDNGKITSITLKIPEGNKTSSRYIIINENIEFRLLFVKDEESA